jgi:hypothetical protein
MVTKASTGDPLTSKLQNAFKAKILERAAQEKEAAE